MVRMREQNFGTPDTARLVRGAAGGDRRGWERLADQYAWLIRVGTAGFSQIAQLRGAPASAGSRCAQWRSVSCLIKDVLRQECS